MRLHTLCAASALVTSLLGMVMLPVSSAGGTLASSTTSPAASPTGGIRTAADPHPWALNVSDLGRSQRGSTVVGTVAHPSQRPPSFAEIHDDSPLVDITIENMAPRIMTTETALTLSMLVTNLSSHPLPTPVVRVYVQTQTPASLEEFSRYFAGERWDGQLVYEAPVTTPIPARSSTPLTVTVPRDSLPLDGEYAWGPRGVTISVTDGDHQAVDRSLLVWDSGQALTPAGATVITPWTTHTVPDAAVERSLLKELTALEAVTLAVDPALFAHPPNSTDTARTSGATGASAELTAPGNPGTTMDAQAGAPPDMTGTTSEGGADSGQSSAAVASSTQADTQRTTTLESTFLKTTSLGAFALLPYDADPGALAALTSTQIRSAVRNQVDAVNRQRPTMPQIIWPTRESFSTTLMNAYSDHAVLAPAGALAVTEELDFTPATSVAVDRATGATAISGPNSDTSTVLSHSELVADLLAWEAVSAPELLDRDQLLTAAGALFTRERPHIPRSFISVLPRTRPLTADTVDRIRALTAPRWVSPHRIDDILTSVPTDIARDQVPDTALASEDLAATERLDAAIDLLGPVTRSVEPDHALRNEIASRTLAAISAGETPLEHVRRAHEMAGYAANIAQAIRAESSVTINLINKTAHFPVRVTNSLEWDARVTVTLVPSDPRLRVTSPVEVLLDANSTTTVDIPVEAIGAGDIFVTYLVTAADGKVIDNAQTVEVRLRAGWEDALTAVFGGIIAVAFIIGLIRTIRRRLRTHEVPGAGGRILQGMIPVSDHPLDQEDQ